MAEEWNIQRMFNTTKDKKVVKTEIDTNETMGLASIVVDVKNQVAYTVPALGQTGYEKLAPLNPQHPDYVLIVASGYNHDVEPAPLKVYVGKKGVGADGKPLPADASERDQFLARNGLLYGKLYGLALANDKFASLGIDKIDTKEKMFDAYLTNPDAPNTFDAVFAPTSYQWGGWNKGVAVGQTEMLKWQEAGEQPEGYTFFVGDSKAEHPAVDPDITKTRYVQSMTYKGGLLGLDFGDMKAVFDAANGALPANLPVKATRTVAAVDGALTIDVANKGIKHGGEGDHSTWQDGSAKTVAPDGLYWVKAADKDVLILDEDSGNALGERKMALPLNAADMTLAEPGKGYLLAIAGGKKNPRAVNKIAHYPGTFSKATSTEFSGSWNISSLIAKKADGSFYTAKELAGTGQQKINGTIALNDSTLIGVVQHKGESAGAVKEVKADQGRPAVHLLAQPARIRPQYAINRGRLFGGHGSSCWPDGSSKPDAARNESLQTMPRRLLSAFLLPALSLPVLLSLVATALPSVAQDQDFITKGKGLFEENCVECHGEDAKSGDSGDIRDADKQQVTMATGGFESMPDFEFEEYKIEAITAYLNSLK